MSKEDLKVIQRYYASLSEMTKKEGSLQQTHSIDEAEHMSELKKDREDDIIDDLSDERKNKKRSGPKIEYFFKNYDNGNKKGICRW